MGCTDAPEFARRSRAWRRSSSSVDGDDVLLPEKMQKLVKTMCEINVIQKGVERGLGVHDCCRSREISPAAMAELRGCSRVAWWLSGGRAWGKRER